MYVSKSGVVWALARAWKVHLAILAVVTLSVVAHQELTRDILDVSGVAVSVVGTAISFFIGFFNAQAYDRWWEARRIWGAFVNDSRSLARMALTFPADDADPGLSRGLIHRHIAFLYAVKTRLRGDPDSPRRYLTPDEESAIADIAHRGNGILLLQGRAIADAQATGAIDAFRLTRLNDLLTRFSDSQGMAERIKTTVFPLYYSTLIQIAIWTYLIVFAITISEVLGYAAIPLAYVLGAIFVFSFSAGQALMNPFDGQPSDTSMTTITRSIEIDLLQQLGDEELPEPVEPVGGWYLP